MVLKPIIASGGTESSVFKIGDYNIVSIILPALDSCNITFKVLDTKAGTYIVLKDKAAATVTIAATTGGFAVGNISEVSGFQYIKIVADAAQNGGARTFKVILKRK